MTAVAVAVAMGMPTPLAAAAGESPADTSPPSTVENGSYPYRDDILALTGADLISGDGNIIFASCSEPHQIKVWARNLKSQESRICFTAANTGVLNVSIPRAYRIETNDRDIKASVSISGTTESFTVPRDTSKGFGESDPNDPQQAVLLKLQVTGTSTPTTLPPAENNPHTFVAKLRIGETSACTGTLVSPRWVLTAKSCFNAAGIPVTGRPTVATTVTVGRTDLTQTTLGATRAAIELVPYTDRDLVLVKLATGVAGVKPVALASTPVTADQAVTAAGFGRTKTEWVPDKLHTGAFTATGDSSADIALTATGEAVICQGDAGGPVLRANGTTQELVAVTSRSWQGGCLGTDLAETRTGAVATRVDDIHTWITDTATLVPGDMSGDNKPDLVAVDEDGKLWLYPGAGTGALGSRIQIGTGGWGGASVAHRGDWTGDGMEDIVATIGGELRVYPNRGDGTLAASVKIGTLPTGAQIVVPGDVNKDGHPDVVASYDNKLYLYTGTSGAKPAVSTPIMIGTGGWGVMDLAAPGDANKDGRVDLLARDTRDGILYYYAGLPDGKNFGERTEYGRGYTTSFRPLIAGAADADRNGVADTWTTAGDGTLKFYKGGTNVHGPIDGPSIQVGTGGWQAIKSIS